MTWPIPTIKGPLGLQPDKQQCRVINRTGSATVVGEIVAFDLTASQTEVTNARPGSTASIYSNVITVTAGLATQGWFAVCEEIAADNAEMLVTVRGRTKALVDGSNAAAIGDYGNVQASNVALSSDAPTTTDEKSVAIIEEASAGAGTTDELLQVNFNGIEGFTASYQ